MLRWFLVVAALLGSLAAPALAETPSGAQAAFLAPFQSLYMAAVADAQANLQHQKDPPANPDIWDITADNQKLVWQGKPGDSAVLMTTFTKASYYSQSVGKTISSAVDLWLTPAPQVKEAVKATNPVGAATTPQLTLSQYLGLPPDNTNDSVVELYVSPQYLIRPAIDPRIDTHAAEREFPITGQSVPVVSPAVLPGQSPAGTLPVAANYADWFIARESAIFSPATPGGAYPWTGLGYTYNWGSWNPVGASEFIAPQSSPVTVKSVTPVGAYFN